MNRPRVAARFRALRVRRGLRQVDLAALARVSRSLVSRIERAQLDGVGIDVLERLAAALGADFEGDLRWRGGDLDGLINRRHAALSDAVVAWIVVQPGWHARAEVSYSIDRDRGIVDIFAWHDEGAVAVIELKTGTYDILENLGTLDRKRRHAGEIATDLEIDAKHISAWLIVADSKTARRRVADHRALVTSQLPVDGRSLRPWFARPTSPVSGLAFWTNAHATSVSEKLAAPRRVRRRAGRG